MLKFSNEKVIVYRLSVSRVYGERGMHSGKDEDEAKSYKAKEKTMKGQDGS